MFEMFVLLNNCFCSYLVLLLPTLPGLQRSGRTAADQAAGAGVDRGDGGGFPAAGRSGLVGANISF